MKRAATLIAVPVMALALAACSTGPGTVGTESAHPDLHLPSSGSGAPPLATPSAVPPEATSGPDPSATDADAAVIGQWGGATEGSPVLWFAPEGRFNGHDGCNSLSGTWTESGQGFALRDMAMTLIGCPGMDTWLSRGAFVRVDGETLRVTDQDGRDIGTLPRINVAG